METGAWDGFGGPHHVREDGVPHGPGSLSAFAPRWLAPFRKADPAVGPAPCPQPAGDGWVLQHKLRRVKQLMMEHSGDAEAMFRLLDTDGGGSLDRLECSTGLYRLGVWLRPKELQALLDNLDTDGGGDIDIAEFIAYWDTYNFE